MSVETDLNKRWELGIPHNPKSVELYKIIAELDWKYGGDSFCFKSGGDGDNGENLMYLLDIHFEQVKQSLLLKPVAPSGEVRERIVNLFLKLWDEFDRTNVQMDSHEEAEKYADALLDANLGREKLSEDSVYEELNQFNVFFAGQSKLRRAIAKHLAERFTGFGVRLPVEKKFKFIPERYRREMIKPCSQPHAGSSTCLGCTLTSREIEEHNKKYEIYEYGYSKQDKIWNECLAEVRRLNGMEEK